MATNYYTVTYLLSSLKRRGLIPSTDEALNTTDFLAFASEELQTYIVELLLGVREEYLLPHPNVGPYDQSIVSGTSSYPLPPRAIAGRLRNVLSSDGTGLYPPLHRLEPEHVHEYGNTGGPAGYIFNGNSVTLVPTPSSTQTLRMQYFMRPSRLVDTTSAAQITLINAGTKTVTCTNVPTNFATTESYDLIKGSPGFECYAIDQAITTRVTGSSGTVTFTNTLPTQLAVGDFVAFAGESPVPQCPAELHPLLSQRVVVRVLEALGDPKVEQAEKTCEVMRRRALTLLQDRSQGSSRPLINRYGPGFRRR